MKTKHKAYFVLDQPEPARTQIQVIRDQLGTRTRQLPVEITVAGSSGIGPVAAGTDVDLIVQQLELVASQIEPFKFQFATVDHFPNTGIYFLRPLDQQPFQQIHQKISKLPLPFLSNPFRYQPHCTIRNAESPTHEHSLEIANQPFPTGEVKITTLSVYELDEETYRAELIHQVVLTG